MYGYIGTFFLSLIFIPQLYSLVSTRNTEGVSTGLWFLRICAALLFLSYGLQLGALPHIVANIVPLIGAVTITLLLVYTNHKNSFWSKTIMCVTALTIAMASVWLFLPTLFVGYLAAAAATVSLFPQVKDSFLSYKHKTPTGVSIPSFILFAIGMLSWILYALFAADIPALITNVLSFGLTIVILLFEVSANKKEEQIA